MRLPFKLPFDIKSLPTLFFDKWPLFVLLIWAILFAVPSSRHLLKVMTYGSPWIRFTLLPNHFADNFSEMPNAPLPIKVRQIQSPNQGLGFTTKMSALPKVDKLISDNPHLPWLIAVRLQIAQGAFSGNRRAGELSDPGLYDNIKKGIPSIEKSDSKVNFTPQQLQETLALCRRGEKLEPQNAYFSWMRFYFSMLSWQDKEARKALSDAASKSYWNNHNAQFRHLYVKAAGDVLGRPLTPYEKISFHVIPVEFLTNGRTRAMGRILGWKGVKLKRAGKQNEALELWADNYHTMTLAAQGASQPIDFLVDYAMLSMAANGATYPSRESFRNEPTKKITEKQRMQDLFAYAKKYHRPDLAQQFEKDWAVNSQLYQKTKYYVQNQQIHTKEMITAMQIGAIILLINVLLIVTLVGALLMWVLLECYRLLTRHKSTFQEHSHSATFWERSKGMAACSGLPSLALALCFLTLFIAITVPSGHIYEPFAGWGISSSLYFHLSNKLSLEPILNLFSDLSHPKSFPVLWRLVVFLAPLIAGASYVLYQSNKKHHDQKKTSFWQALGRRFHLGLLYLALGIPVLTTHYGSYQIILTTICILFLLVSFIWMWLKTKDNSVFKLSLFQMSLSGWILIGSFTLLKLVFSQASIDSQIRPWANHQLHGEMHGLHDVADTPPTQQ